MPVAIELQNLGEAQLCREIAASIEHSLSDKRGEWRVSIAGSRASENWEMRVEGLNGFERRQFADRFSTSFLQHQTEHEMSTVQQVAREPHMRQIRNASHRLDEHILRALNKIKKPSTA